jgi:hypothetical protein
VWVAFLGKRVYHGNVFWLIKVRFATAGVKREGAVIHTVENKTSSMSGKKLNYRTA